jgi:hypothetical protein
MPTLRASCLCGGVKFEISGPLSPPSNCHCSMCRKQQGAAFRSRARIRQSDLKWVQGEDLVRFYGSTSGTFRGFAASAGRQSSTNSMRGRNQRRIGQQRLQNMGLRWLRLMTIRACDLSLTYSLRAKRRGSR